MHNQLHHHQNSLNNMSHNNNPFSQPMVTSQQQQHQITFHDLKPSLVPLQSPGGGHAQGVIIPDFRATAAAQQQQQQIGSASSPPQVAPTSPPHLQPLAPMPAPAPAVTTTAQFIQPIIPVSTANIKTEPTLLASNQKVLTQILPNNQQQQQNITIQNNKLFSFAGMPIGTSAGIFATTAGGNTILLPQLQLAVVQQQQDNGGGAGGNGDKLPMKRLTPNNHQLDGKTRGSLNSIVADKM
jgi:hypothetical protein